MWNVVLINTTNGQRIGIDERETDAMLASGLTCEAADAECYRLSEELDIPVYSEEDGYLGLV